MKYVLPYKTVKFTNESMDTVDSALKNPQFEDGTIGVTQNPEEAIDILGEKEYKELLTTRSSKVSWIDDPRLTILLSTIGLESLVYQKKEVIVKIIIQQHYCIY